MKKTLIILGVASTIAAGGFFITKTDYFQAVMQPPEPPIEEECNGTEPELTICHRPGTPAEKEMVIPREALKGHLGHGDNCGPCK